MQYATGRAFRSSSVKMVHNSILNNAYNGTIVLNSSLEALANIISGNQGCGVYATDNSTITGSGNDISDNKNGDLCPPPSGYLGLLGSEEGHK